MSADYFLDTNLFVYAIDDGDTRKRDVAQGLIRESLSSGLGCTSSQVVQEFLNVALKQARHSLGIPQARAYVDAAILPLVRVWPSADLYHQALDAKARWGFGFYDSLIVAAAKQSGVSRLLTEDLQDGQRLDGLVIENPFR